MPDLNLSTCPICGASHSLLRQVALAGEHEIVWYECRTCDSFLLSAGDDQGVYQKVGRAEKAHLLTRSLTTSELQALTEAHQMVTVAPEPDEPDEPVEPAWGARVNTKWRRGAKDYPPWASNYQRNRWQKQGLLLWDRELQRVTHLTATQALAVLELMRANEDWQYEGVVIGEPAVRLVIDKKEEHEPRASMLNEMTLSADQALELFELLERREAELQEMCEEEREDRKRRLWRVYSILRDLADRAEAEESGPSGEP